MRSRRAVLVLALAWIITLGAGCTVPGFSDPDERTSSFLAFGDKSASQASRGFALEDNPVHRWRLGASVDVSDLDDDGAIVVGGLTHLDNRFYMRIDRFNGSEPYQDGGIAAGLTMHGATGRGEAALPQSRVLMAGWGDAILRVDDIPYPNPMTGRLWPAYFMVLDKGIHDEGTGGVAEPSGGPELLVVFASHEGEWTEPLAAFPIFVQQGEPAPVADPAYQYEYPFPNMAWGSTGVFEIVLETDLPSLAGTELTFAVIDPADEVVAQETLGGAGTTARATVRVPMDELGAYVLRVTGQATAARFTVIGLFEATDPVVGVLVWEDVLLGKDARQAIKKWRLAEEHAQLGGEPPPEPGFAVPVRVDDVIPPGLNLIIVAVGVAASLLCGLLVAKLAMDSVKGRQFQDTFRKRK